MNCKTASIYKSRNLLYLRAMPLLRLDQTRLNYFFCGGLILCFLSAFFVDLHTGPIAVADTGDSYAGEDSGNLFYALFLFFPFLISRIFLRKRPISLLEVFYFPLALMGSLILPEIGNFPLSHTIPSTLRYGPPLGVVFLVVYLIGYLSFILAYAILTFRQVRNLWAMYAEGW